MKKLKKKKKLTRKEIKKPDQFITTTQRIYKFGLQYRNIILPAIIAAFLLFLIVYGIVYFKEKRLSTASYLLFRAEQKVYVHIQDKEYSREVEKSLKKVMETYPLTPYDGRARILLARYMVLHKKYKEAEEVLKPFAEEEWKEPYVQSAGLDLLGFVREKSGDLPGACEAYVRITEMDINPLGIKPFEDAGRCYEKLGDLTAAIRWYNEALTKYRSSPRARAVALRLKNIYLKLQQ